MVSLITLQKTTWLNFHKILNFICIQTCDRPNFKKPDKKHAFMMSTQKGRGEGVLKNCHVFADFIILNIRSIVNFCKWWKWEGHLLVIFCGRHIWVTSKTIIQKKSNAWNQKASNIPKILNLIKTNCNLILNFHPWHKYQEQPPSSGIYFFKANNGNARTMLRICSKLTTINTPEQGQ